MAGDSRIVTSMLDCGCAQRQAWIGAKLPVLRNLRTTITTYDVVAEAKTWLGTKFHHQGYSKAGADCIGLVCGVALALGIQGAQEWKDGPYHAYGRPPQPRFLIETADRFLDRADVYDLRLADILVMSFEREPMHFALVSSLDPLYVIHSLYGVGRVVEHRIDANWRGRIRMVYRFRGL